MLSATTPGVRQRHPEALDVLTAPERQRASAFRRPADRDDFVAAHVLVRECAGLVAGLAPSDITVVQRCERCGRPHGRPFLPDQPHLAISLSHSAGRVAAAAGAQLVGVDVEVVDGAGLDERVVAATLAPAERAAVERADDPPRAFLQFWVRKEALVKVGVVTLETVSGLDLSSLPRPDPAAATPGPQWCAAVGCSVLDWADGDLVGAVAFAGRPPVSQRAPRRRSGRSGRLR